MAADLTERWLAFCRRQRPELTDAEFEAMKPDFLRLYRQLNARKRRGAQH